MLYARSQTGESVPASRDVTGVCGICGEKVIAKCGEIVAWHWAHHARPDCDPWAEPESPWHRAWKESVPRDHREVTIGGHRADMIVCRDSRRVVVELQHSTITPAAIRERENEYGAMVWIFDARDAYENGRLEFDGRHDRQATYRTFWWKHPRKSVSACHQPIWLDLGREAVFEVRRFGQGGADGKWTGWGHLHPRGVLDVKLACSGGFCWTMLSDSQGATL